MANLNIRLDDTLKEQSFAIIERLGMTPSQAIKMFLTQIAQTGAVPLSLDYIAYEQNPTTMQAIDDFRKGKVHSVSDGKALMDALNAD